MNSWLDEHTGPTWVYGMKYRPAHPGFTHPLQGYLLCLIDDPARRHPQYPHGLVHYSRPLTPEEVASYELDVVATPNT